MTAKKMAFLILMMFSFIGVKAQSTGTIIGNINTLDGVPVEHVTISLKGT
ncbi:hypothetical protein [Galbibacter sp. PAP.153]